MSVKDDGGPAFPSEGEGHNNPKYHSPGMTLRDWFAGQALAGAMTSSWGEAVMKELNEFQTARAMTMSSFAYQLADAMLAARTTGEKK